MNLGFLCHLNQFWFASRLGVELLDGTFNLGLGGSFDPAFQTQNQFPGLNGGEGSAKEVGDFRGGKSSCDHVLQLGVLLRSPTRMMGLGSFCHT